MTRLLSPVYNPDVFLKNFFLIIITAIFLAVSCHLALYNNNIQRGQQEILNQTICSGKKNAEKVPTFLPGETI